MPYTKLRAQTDRVARILKAVANARRLSILCELANGEQSVSELQEAIGISQSALSQHLARLRRDKLVVTRRDAQNIYYSIEAGYLPDLLDSLDQLIAANAHDGASGTMHSTA